MASGHVVLSAPETWHAEVRAGATIYDVMGDGVCEITVTGFGALPEDHATWLRQQIRAGLPDGIPMSVLHSANVTTEDGWPAHTTEVVVATTEARLVVMYSFFGHGAAAVVRCTNLARYAEVRAEIVSVLRRARPAWHDQDVVCLERLLASAT
jgi:hypothetical protein